MSFSPPEQTYNTKQEIVYRHLREAIMLCELEPGRKLVIQNIANELGVSPIPVREALRILNSEGLVEHRAHIGSIVAPITEASVVETFTIKEGLDAVATRIAVERITEQDIDRLAELCSAMDRVLKEETYELWGDLNRQFHATFVELTKMPLLIDMSIRVMDAWDRIRRYFFNKVLVHRLVVSQEEHQNIMKAVYERDSEEAARLVQLHNRNALQDYLERVGSSSGHFPD